MRSAGILAWRELRGRVPPHSYYPSASLDLPGLEGGGTFQITGERGLRDILSGCSGLRAVGELRLWGSEVLASPSVLGQGAGGWAAA